MTIHGINIVSANLCVDNNLFLGFDESNHLKTLVDDKLVNVDLLQKEDMTSNIGLKTNVTREVEDVIH